MSLPRIYHRDSRNDNPPLRHPSARDGNKSKCGSIVSGFCGLCSCEHKEIRLLGSMAASLRSQILWIDKVSNKSPAKVATRQTRIFKTILLIFLLFHKSLLLSALHFRAPFLAHSSQNPYFFANHCIFRGLA